MGGRVLGCLGVRLNSGEFGAKSSDEAEYARGAITGALPNKLRGCFVFPCRLTPDLQSAPSASSASSASSTPLADIHSVSRILLAITAGICKDEARYGRPKRDLRDLRALWTLSAGPTGSTMETRISPDNGFNHGFNHGFNPGGWLNDAHRHFLQLLKPINKLCPTPHLCLRL